MGHWRFWGSGRRIVAGFCALAVAVVMAVVIDAGSSNQRQGLLVAVPVGDTSTQSESGQTMSAGTDAEQQADTEFEPSPGLVSALARDFDLSSDDAEEVIAREITSATAAAEAETALGSASGGSWIDADGRTNVAVVGGLPDETDLSDTTVRSVAWSEAELNRSMDRLNALAVSQPAGLAAASGWYVDIIANRVVVQTGDKQGVLAFLRSAEVNIDLLDFDDAVQHQHTASSHGAARYETDSASGSQLCSIGFAVVGGFITAGHCGPEVGRSVAFTSPYANVGQVEQSISRGADAAFVRLNPGHEVLPEVTSPAGPIPIHGSAEAPVGATVCRSGASSGYHCGKVTSRNATYNFNGAIATNQLTTTVCASSGDSGGPLIWGNQAQGVTSTSNGNCGDPASPYSSYHPVNEILNRWGLTLKTAGGHDPGPTTSTTVSPPVTAAPPSGEVVLFSDWDFGGRWWSVGSGVYDWPMVDGSPVGNDAISSIRVPSGFTVRVCEHDGGAGVCRVHSSSVSQLVALNDRVSFVEVSAGLPQAPSTTSTAAPPATTTAPPVPATTVAPPPSGSVVLYQHTLFGGVSWSVGPGVYDWPVVDGSPVGNDALSSIRVPSGFTVRVCEHGGGDGTCRSFTSSVSDLGSMNDRVSYIEVIAGPPPPSGSVVLYRDTLFGGVSWSVGPGVYDWPVVDGSPVGNDALSSIRVPSGFTVRVCEHGGGDGTCRSFTSSVSDLGPMNDRVSYIEVTS